ncbi:MAG TPA: hypothetical protein VJ843_04260 [Candidatus Saccharimonadales bacterium]|nr:hypothetical protein [Candidatus Saccharimonadales bacterium]
MEENAKSQHKRPAPRTLSKTTKIIISTAVVLTVAAVGFFGGVQYQKSKKTSTASNGGFQSTGGSGMMMGPGGQHMGEAGTVTAVSATSISFNSQRSSSVVTYAITSSTTITDNGTTVTASDIAVGDMVLVESSGSGSTTATRIVVNPSPTSGPQMDSSGGTTQTN